MKQQTKRRAAQAAAVSITAALFIGCLIYGLTPSKPVPVDETPAPTAAVKAAIPTQKPQTPRQQERSLERQIWDLINAELPETATAAIIGNMRHESGLSVNRCEGLSAGQSEMLADEKTGSRNDFIYISTGYGLCGWSGTAQLSKLWDFCEERGYKVDTAEGQTAYLLYDLKGRHKMCYERLMRYQPEDLITATEDFRQSYERSISAERDKWCRATYARDYFTLYCKDVYDIKRVATLPFTFDIYETVQHMNEDINNEIRRNT